MSTTIVRWAIIKKNKTKHQKNNKPKLVWIMYRQALDNLVSMIYSWPIHSLGSDQQSWLLSGDLYKAKENLCTNYCHVTGGKHGWFRKKQQLLYSCISERHPILHYREIQQTSQCTYTFLRRMLSGSSGHSVLCLFTRINKMNTLTTATYIPYFRDKACLIYP